jgi:hypothetical protein
MEWGSERLFMKAFIGVDERPTQGTEKVAEGEKGHVNGPIVIGGG